MTFNAASVMTVVILALVFVVAVCQIINPRFLYNPRWNPVGRTQGIFLAVVVGAFIVDLLAGKLHIA